MMVDVGEQKGVIQNSAKDMIANIFEFDDTTVTEIMTHRTDMTAVEDTSSISEAVNLSIENGYSRIPVYHEDLDDIVGIVYVKDLLKYVCSQMPEETKLTDVMRGASFIPETKRCSELFAEMTASKTQMAIIVDEYGGTEGLVTMEDLVEAIVGNIQDEYDNEEEEIHKVNDNTFTVDGTAPSMKFPTCWASPSPRRLRHCFRPGHRVSGPHSQAGRASHRQYRKRPLYRGTGRKPKN